MTMAFWIGLGATYFVGTAITWGIITERDEGIDDSAVPLLSLLWPLLLLLIPLGIIALIGYLPYRLGKFLGSMPERLQRRRERLAEIARRMRACPHCDEPHDPNDECEEDALMRRG